MKPRVIHKNLEDPIKSVRSQCVRLNFQSLLKLLFKITGREWVNNRKLLNRLDKEVSTGTLFLQNKSECNGKRDDKSEFCPQAAADSKFSHLPPERSIPHLG